MGWGIILSISANGSPGIKVAYARKARLIAMMLCTTLLLSGCENFRLFGSGGSSSKPDIGVGVEF